jgi:hypothetical protein
MASRISGEKRRSSGSILSSRQITWDASRALLQLVAEREHSDGQPEVLQDRRAQGIAYPPDFGKCAQGRYRSQYGRAPGAGSGPRGPLRAIVQFVRDPLAFLILAEQRRTRKCADSCLLLSQLDDHAVEGIGQRARHNRTAASFE